MSRRSRHRRSRPLEARQGERKPGGCRGEVGCKETKRNIPSRTSKIYVLLPHGRRTWVFSWLIHMTFFNTPDSWCWKSLLSVPWLLFGPSKPSSDISIRHNSSIIMGHHLHYFQRWWTSQASQNGWNQGILNWFHSLGCSWGVLTYVSTCINHSSLLAQVLVSRTLRFTRRMPALLRTWCLLATEVKAPPSCGIGISELFTSTVSRFSFRVLMLV